MFSFLGDIGLSFVLKTVGFLAYAALTVASWFLRLCATLLDASMNLTLHIKDLLTVMPAVYSTWALIRDISSMFFIFMLLYAAIMMILGLEDKLKIGMGSLIKNLILAGVLINFSFFFVSVMIDFSNIVSLQFYNAIAPGKEFVPGKTGYMDTIFDQGGISNVFMQALSPQSIYANNAALKNGTSDTDQQINMIIAGVGGTAVMIIAALSFLTISFAFIIRTGMLLLLLAFSPLWMAGMVIPKIKDELSAPWMKYLYSNLVFMPVYLLFTYVAMRMMLGDDPTGTNGPSTAIANTLFHTAANSTNQGILGSSIFGMILSYVLALLFILAPLAAAMKIGGSTTDWAKKYSGLTGKAVGNWVGTRTLGRAAYSMNESGLMKRVAGFSPIAGSLASGGLSKLSSAGFGVKKGGYEDKLRAKIKREEDLSERIGRVDRSKYANEEDYENAVAKAKGHQKKYAKNLPWSNKLYNPSGIIGFMVDNRANRQTGFTLKEEANLKENEKEQKELLEAVTALDRGAMTEENKRERARLEDRLKEVKASVKRVSKKKGSKDIEKMIKAFADKSKSEGGEEKPKPEGGSEKPKTT